MKCSKQFAPIKFLLRFFHAALAGFLLQCLGVMMATEDDWKEKAEEKNPVKAALLAYGLRGSSDSNAPDQGPPEFTADIFYQEVAAHCNPEPCLHPDLETHPFFKSSDFEKNAATSYKNEMDARRDLPDLSSSELKIPDPDAPVSISDDEFINKAPLSKDLAFAASLYNNSFDGLSTYEVTRLILLDIEHAEKGAKIRRNYELKKSYIESIGGIARLDVLIAYNREKELINPLWLEAEKLALIQMRREYLRELTARNVWKKRADIDNYLKLFPEYFPGEGGVAL